MAYSISPATNPPITPDPKRNGSTIRKAFLLEALANLFTIPLIIHTRLVLTLLLANPSHVNPASILFARLFGGLVVGGLTTALLFGTMNTRNGIESRRPTYTLLGLGEASLMPILGMEVRKGGGEDAALSVKVAVGCVGALLPLLVWRGYVLFIRPDLVGRYREEGGGGGGGGCGWEGEGSEV